jgi:Mitochondrial pyruvate carriers
MKWALVLTGVSDFFRPAEKLSLTQNLALTATGTIWTRWCFIIKPKNYLYEPFFNKILKKTPFFLRFSCAFPVLVCGIGGSMGQLG